MNTGTEGAVEEISKGWSENFLTKIGKYPALR
jgi:hypothetical protein